MSQDFTFKHLSSKDLCLNSRGRPEKQIPFSAPAMNYIT